MASLLVSPGRFAKMAVMICRLLWLGWILGWSVVSYGAPVKEGGRKPVVPVVRQQSSVAPLISVAPTLLEARQGLELAEMAWRVFASTLQVKVPPQKTQIILQWVVVEDPTVLPREEFPGKVRLTAGRKEFVIERYGEVKPTQELIVRSLMNAYLQALAWDGEELNGVGTIPRAPYWMAEGLVQKAQNRHPDEIGEIIHRLERTGTLPKLAEVQTWEEGGAIRMERLIHRAVAYWLLRQATLSPVESASLRVWWQSQRLTPKARYWESDGRRETWWREVARNKAPQDLPLLSWDQTANHVREALHFSGKLKGENESRILSILDLPNSPADLADLAGIKEVEGKIQQAQMRAHWLWQYVLAKYSEALTAWSGGKYALYRQRLQEALALQQQLDGLVKRTGDYLDWFTVNYGLLVDDPEWEDYRKLVQEIEKAREPFEGKRAADGTRTRDTELF
jgi:hypothetical protein